MGKPRPPRGNARDPFRARGAEPLQNLEASLCACIDAPGIRAGTKIPSSALRRPGRYAHRNGRSRIDPLTHGPNAYDSTGDEITLDELERIRI